MERGRHASVILLGPFAVKIFKRGLEENARKEWFFLRYLRKFGFAPRPYFRFGRIIVMERIWGKNFRQMTEEEIKRHARGFLEILRRLDDLGIQKEECHRPDKHFIVSSRGLRLIDFERAHFSKKPSNVTQFLAYLSRFYTNAIDVAKRYRKGNADFSELK